MTGAAERIERLTGQAVRDLRAAGSQHRWAHYRAVLADGRAAFAKVASTGLGGVFEAEARGLRWLGEAGAVAVPEVLGWDEATLVVSWVAAGRADNAAAERFGRDLARMHRAGAPSFGAPWPGFIASLFLPNDDLAAPAASAGRDPWPDWYTARRVLPYLRLAVDAGTLNSADAGLIESAAARAADLTGPAEPPSRIHGAAGPGTWSGPADQGGWWILPRTAGTGRPTWPCLPCSGRQTWTGSWVRMRRSGRWPPGGGSACPCTNCTRCWCTCACSGPPTAKRRWPPPARCWPHDHGRSPRPRKTSGMVRDQGRRAAGSYFP